MANKDMGSLNKPNALYTSGTAIDTQGAESLQLIAPSKATTSIAVTESADDSTYTDVDASYILVHDDDGVLTGNDVLYSESGTASISYVGKSRYVKFTVTDAVASTSLVVLLGNLQYAPDEA